MNDELKRFIDVVIVPALLQRFLRERPDPETQIIEYQRAMAARTV
jgi:hypothetical protein